MASASVHRISAVEYEQLVKATLDAGVSKEELLQYESRHLEAISGADGEYTFDVTVRFRNMTGDHLVLIECKRHRRKVERELVMVLYGKIQSVGAQKGMLFSTAGFQSGAVEYAQQHGLALVRLDETETEWITRGGDGQPSTPAAASLPYCGYWYHEADDLVPLTGNRRGAIREALGLVG
jgi:restriction system protein